MEKFDLVIVGSGQAATPLATSFAAAGKTSAIIEQNQVGGTCINVGCTPTKTMVASARVAYLARRARDYGVHAGPITVDMYQVRQRKQAIVESFRGGSERRIANAGVQLIRGQARFTGAKTLEVAAKEGGVARQLTAETIVINAGARPQVPDIPGLDRVDYLDSSSIMELEQLPQHLLILGGGYVALEFGQMFSRFGSQVTIVERSGQLLAREDPDVAGAMLDILKEDGIEVLLNANAVKVERSAQDGIRLTLRTGEGERILDGSHLLLAAGRVPNSDLLNLAAAGINTNKIGFITTNDYLETSAAGIYAAGDVKGGPAFTHISYDDFRILKTNLLDGGKASVQGRMVPYTVFTDPQLGRIGMSEKEAAQTGRNVRAVTMPMNYVARALEVGEARGLMKVVVDLDSQQILGAAILGIEGGEIMSMLQIAMLGRLPYTVLRDATFAHPTLAESLNNLFASLPG